jgi:hypothetical protein
MSVQYVSGSGVSPTPSDVLFPLTDTGEPRLQGSSRTTFGPAVARFRVTRDPLRERRRVRTRYPPPRTVARMGPRNRSRAMVLCVVPIAATAAGCGSDAPLSIGPPEEPSVSAVQWDCEAFVWWCCDDPAYPPCGTCSPMQYDQSLMSAVYNFSPPPGGEWDPEFGYCQDGADGIWWAFHDEAVFAIDGSLGACAESGLHLPSDEGAGSIYINTQQDHGEIVKTMWHEGYSRLNCTDPEEYEFCHDDDGFLLPMEEACYDSQPWPV